MSHRRNQYQYKYGFVAGPACYAKVAQTMSETLLVLEVIHRSGVVLDAEEYALDFSSEILNLKAALRVMGMDDEDGSEAKLDV